MATRQIYLGYAEAAAQVLTDQWFPADGPHNWVVDNQDFWRAPNLMTALTGLMQLTGSRRYLTTAKNALSSFEKYFDPAHGRFPGWYDDEAWWGALFLRLGALTHESKWAEKAREIFNDLQGGWDDVAGGGVWWMRNPPSYPRNEKGSIENEVYMDIAMGLYATDPGGGLRYLETANQTWQWMQALIDDAGLVWGSLDKDAKIKLSNPGRPYNQGVILGPLWAMFKVAGDTTYLDRAEQIVEATFATMRWPDGILRELCEARGDCGENDTNPALFKGVFVRYLGEFVERLASLDDPRRKESAQKYAVFLQRNADAVWTNYPGGVYGMDWRRRQPSYQPSGVLFYDGALQSSALDLFVAAARVSQ